MNQEQLIQKVIAEVLSNLSGTQSKAPATKDKIIDFRFRPHTKETLLGLSRSPIFREGLIAAGVDLEAFEAQAQSVEEVVKEMRQNGIYKAVLVGRDAESTYGFKPNNNGLAEFIASAPDIFVGFAGLDPHKGMGAIRELCRLVNEKGFKGAAIDPIYNKLYLNDKKFYPIYSKCCELDIPIIITSGPARFTPETTMDFARPIFIDEVATDFPELRIVVSHGGYPWVSEMIGVTFRNKNVFLEISEYEKFPMGAAFFEAGNTILQDQLLFASAHPFVNYLEAIKLYKEEFPIKPEILDKIMYKNAERVLKLK